MKKITQNITTKSDLVYFLDDINEARREVFKETESSFIERVKKRVSKEFLEILKEEKEKGKLNTKEDQINFLDELSEYLQKVETIKLTLAFSPSKSFLQKIKEWTEKQIGEEVILNLRINHKVVGGAIIEYKGKYLNLSLADKINKSVAKKGYERI